MWDFVLGCATNDDCQNGTICKIDEDVARSFNHEISQIFAETPKKGLCVAKPSGPTNDTDCEKGVNCQSDDEGSGSSDYTFNENASEKQTKIIDNHKQTDMKPPQMNFISSINDANLDSNVESNRKGLSK